MNKFIRCSLLLGSLGELLSLGARDSLGSALLGIFGTLWLGYLWWLFLKDVKVVWISIFKLNRITYALCASSQAQYERERKENEEQGATFIKLIKKEIPK